MLKGFKDFLMRGNVVDLAVAVIIGTAFTAVVTAVVTNIIQPLIDVIGPQSTGKVGPTLGHKIQDGKQVPIVLDFGAVITAVINFLVIAAVVYFMIVLPVKKIMERRRRGQEPGPAEPTDVELLTEIRDLLREQQSRGGTRG